MRSFEPMGPNGARLPLDPSGIQSTAWLRHIDELPADELDELLADSRTPRSVDKLARMVEGNAE